MIKRLIGMGMLLWLCFSGTGAFAQDMNLPPKPNADDRAIYQEQILDLAGQCEAAGLAEMAFDLRNIATEAEDSIHDVALRGNTCPCNSQDVPGACTCGAPVCKCCAGHMRCCTYTHGSPIKRCRTKCVFDTWYCP